MIQNLIFGAYLLISGFLAESLKANKTKLAKKITHFTIKFHSKNHIHLIHHSTNLVSFNIVKNILPQHSQKTYLLYKFSRTHVSGWFQKNICTAPFLKTQELHSPSTWKANFCIFSYISVEDFCSRDVESFFLVGDWIIFSKWLDV